MKILRQFPLPTSKWGTGKHRASNRSKFYDVARQMERGDCVILKTKKDVASLTFNLKALGHGVATRKMPDSTIGVWCIEPTGKPIRSVNPFYVRLEELRGADPELVQRLKNLSR